MLHIVTVATGDGGYLRWLKQSCARNNCELVILGYGSTWTGFKMKYDLVLEYLETIPEDDLVCFVDGYDVVVSRDIRELQEEYERLSPERKILVCHDRTNKEILMIPPFRRVANRYFMAHKDTPLNSGTYMGPSEKVKEYILETQKIMDEFNTTDDQKAMNIYYSRHEDLLDVDFNHEVFLVSYGDQDVTDENGNFSVGGAFFVHMPGKTEMGTLIRQLGYEISDEDNLKIDFANKIRCIPLVEKYSNDRGLLTNLSELADEVGKMCVESLPFKIQS